MNHLIPSGKTALDRFDSKGSDPNKVFSRVDGRLLGDQSQFLAECTKGFSLSGNEGVGLVDQLSIITANDTSTYKEEHAKSIQTLIANASLLSVDAGSTANSIILTKRTIATGAAPNTQNYCKAAPLPHKYEDYLSFKFIPTIANTGAVVAQIQNWEGFSGSKSLVDESGAELTGGELVAGEMVEIYTKTFSGTQKLVLRKLSNQSIGFSVYLGSNQVINTNIFTKISFATGIIVRNDNNIFNVANSRFTPNVAGWYNINCGLYYQAPLAPNNAYFCNAIIYKNGSIYKGINQSYCQNNNQETINSFFIYMNGSSDYLELYGLAGVVNPTYTIIAGVSSYFQAFKI